jgi:hypothetical protein
MNVSVVASRAWTWSGGIVSRGRMKSGGKETVGLRI